MHLAERLQVPEPYTARAYRGRADHPAMATVLSAHREHTGSSEMVNAAQLDAAYTHIENCDPDNDIALVERDGSVVAYVRAFWELLESGTRDLIVFTPMLPGEISEPLLGAMVEASEEHMRPWATDATRYRAFAHHPGPDEPAVGEAAWLEARGYVATEWSAYLVRPHLDDIPERPLPEGVVSRPVVEDDVRTILEAHLEAFRGEWDFHEPTESDIADFIDDPLRDITLWQVAWAGDTVVGQVKPYINDEENLARGYLRGYTEDISTHHDWRGQGIAGALLAASLRAVRERGMTDAALGVDTNNPGGAFQLYTALGFELQAYEAVYTKPVR